MQVHLYTEWSSLKTVIMEAQKEPHLQQNVYIHACTKELSKHLDVHISVPIEDVVMQIKSGVYSVCAYHAKR